MSQQQQNDSKTPTAIKIAAKEASQRNSSGGPADPGPGDPSAAPSVAPQLVDIPPAPTPSELVVKSASQAPLGSSRAASLARPSSGGASPGSALSAAKSAAITTLYENRSGSSRIGSSPGPKSAIMASMSAKKSSASIQASQMGPAASNPSVGAPREPTSSRPLTGPSGALQSGVKSSSGPNSTAAGHASSSAAKPASGSNKPEPSSPKSTTMGSHKSTSSVVMSSHKSTSAAAGSHRSSKPVSYREVSSGSAVKSAAAASGSGASPQPSSIKADPPATASVAMQADSGAVHDEDEEGEGEVEVPDNSPAATSPTGALKSSASNRPSSHKSRSVGHSGSNMDHVPASSAGGKSKMSTKTGHGAKGASSPSTGASEAGSSHLPSDSASEASPLDKDAKSKKKVTKFRYHKRITVRTSGKASPSAVMSKVNKREHRQNITPSTIDDLDPQELLKRAGIKNTNQSHWRVRLRQTKRTTHNGKTTTQTKVAYRDSEGNKRVKTSTSPYCKTCSKKLEECKCDASSQQ